MATKTKAPVSSVKKSSLSKTTRAKPIGRKPVKKEPLKKEVSEKPTLKKTTRNSAEAKSKATVKPPKFAGHKQERDELDMNHFRSLLVEERHRLEEELDTVRNRKTDMDNALPEEGEGGDEDTADLAAAMMDKEMDLSVEDELEEMLSQVDRAFQKIEEGTYGVCDVSDKHIPKSRLEVIPWATLTVECQSMSEG